MLGCAKPSPVSVAQSVTLLPYKCDFGITSARVSCPDLARYSQPRALHQVITDLASEIGGQIPNDDGPECACFCSPSSTSFIRVNVIVTVLAGSCPVKKYANYDCI